MQRNRGRGFRGGNNNNPYRGGRRNDDRHQQPPPWKANYDEGYRRGTNVSPWLCDANNARADIPSLMSMFVDRGGNQNQGGGGFQRMFHHDRNDFEEPFSNQNRPRLDFVPPESREPDGGYWQQCSNPYRGQNDFQHQRRGDGLRGNFRRRPYDRPQRGKSKPDSRWGSREEEHAVPVPEEPAPEPELSPLEARIEKLMDAVKSQPHGVGELVLLQNNNEIPPVLLNNAAHQVKNCVLAIDRDESSGYSKLLINGLSIAEGMYSTKKDAKEALYEMGLEVLRGKCFFLTSKSHFEEVSMEDLAKQKEQEQAPAVGLEGSKAHQMMLKMGWGGKGLGTQEQGEQKSVAEKITENITREGLGTQNVMQEVQKILYDYARSNKSTTLAFDSSFTKEERAQIHAIAAKYHLRSKSEGGLHTRRITVSKKKNKWMIVREVLMAGGENESYALTIPDEYEEMWKELCAADGVEV